MSAAIEIPAYHAVRMLDVDRIRDMMGRMGPDVVEEGQSLAEWMPDLLRTAYVATFVRGVLVGLTNFDRRTPVVAQAHVNVLPDYRRAYRHESCAVALRWLLRETPYRKVVAHVPVVFPHVRRFAREMGFELEGVDRASFKHKGALVDRWIFGMTGPEMEASCVQYL